MSSALRDRPAGQKKAAQMVSAGFFAGSNCRVSAMIRIVGTEVSAALVVLLRKAELVATDDAAQGGLILCKN